MSGKKGMKHYPQSIKDEIIVKQQNGQSVCSLSKEYRISRWAIQCWCGLRPEITMKKIAPRKKGRPRKTPISTPQELEKENKRLRMENELLRDFLYETERGCVRQLNIE